MKNIKENEKPKVKRTVYIRPKIGIYLSYTFRSVFCFIIFSITLLLALYLIKDSINIIKEKNINFSEETKIDYKVYLKENTFYSSPYLGKDMMYVASLIDNININFDYLIKTEEQLNINFEYYIMGKLSIVNSNNKKVYFEKEYELLKKQSAKMNDNNSQKIVKDINIDYNYYNLLSNDFKAQYGIDTESYLTVYMVIQKKIDENVYVNNFENTMSVSIPLSEKSIEIKIDSNEFNKKNEFVNNSQMFIKDKNILIISIILIVFSIIYLIKFIKKISILFKSNKFDKYIDKLLKSYDRLIVESSTINSFEGKDIIKLKTFNELLDVHDNLQLPIIYYNITKHIKSYFYIIHNDIVYLYVVKAVDIGGKYEKKK